MKTDVKAKTMAVSGTVYGARTRVRGVVVMPASGNAATVVLSDGDTSVMTFSTVTNNVGIPFSVNIPEDGVLFSTSVKITLTNATAIVFYG